MRRCLSIAWHMVLLALFSVGPFYRIDWQNISVTDPIVSSYIGGAMMMRLCWKIGSLLDDGGQS